MKKLSFAVSLILFVFCSQLVFAQTRLPVVAPEEIGLDAASLAFIDVEVQKGLEAKSMPGCVVCVGRSGKIGYLKAFGDKQVQTEAESARAMTTDTVFDMASLTKPIATATSVMVLVDQGKINVDEKVVKYMKEFDTPEKRDITVRQLLTHTAGFIPDNHIRDYEQGTVKAIENLLALKPNSEPGSEFKYSDVSFQLLGLLVERVSGKDVNAFSQEYIFKPLGMSETTYNPGTELSARAAPTQDRELGKVHDPRAFRTDGIAGHAGLFSTAEDLAVYATMMLDMGQFPGKPRILKAETVDMMTTLNRVPRGYRGLGWDMRTGYSSNRGQNMSTRAYGHGGFTGTSMWIDPGHDLFVIFLSNRVHPDGKGSVNPLAGRIGTIAIDAITDMPTGKEAVIERTKARANHYRHLARTSNATTDGVLTGLDTMALDDFALFRGKRVGLITNQTGAAKDGTFITKFLKDKGVELTALFSPEHGFTGDADHSNIEDSKDPNTGLTVFSIYGQTRKPTPEMLDNVDVLVFDMQDVGVRFYTYTSTMALGMEAAAEKGIPFVVLDRPNPIRGDHVEGPILQPGLEAFVAFHKMPVQHGMTMGEMALMMAVERKTDVDLHVVPCAGWERSQDYDATKLPWINPSPNMKSLTAAYFYPGVGLIEFTNVAVGRGTDIPFEHFGAPWIEGEQGAKELADALNEAAKNADLQGVSFAPTSFVPSYREFVDEICYGVKLTLEDRQTLKPVRLGLVIMTTLRKLYPETWNVKNLNTLLLHDQSRQMILDGASVADIEATWTKEFDRFMQRRALYLLYQ